MKTSFDGNMVPYYHYTSLETLYKILASGKLRLTACDNLKNAAVETMALEVALKKHVEKEGVIRKYMEEREKSYMVCFSKESPEVRSSNSDMLWKYYADNNKGVVIKFDYTKFPFMAHGSKASYPDVDVNALEEIDIINSDLQGQRDTEFRMFSMMYEQEKFIKQMKGKVVPSVFLIDS